MPGSGVVAAAVEAMAGRGPDIMIAKPKPDLLLKAAESMGLQPGECLMVGDSLKSDIPAAAAAGMPSLLVLTGGVTQEQIERRSPRRPLSPSPSPIVPACSACDVAGSLAYDHIIVHPELTGEAYASCRGSTSRRSSLPRSAGSPPSPPPQTITWHAPHTPTRQMWSKGTFALSADVKKIAPSGVTNSYSFSLTRAVTPAIPALDEVHDLGFRQTGGARSPSPPF